MQMSDKKEKVVITGGAGFVGSHLADRLLKEGYDVHVIDNLVAGNRENVPKDAQFHELDITNLEDIKPIIKGAKYVFHEAALPRVQYSIDFPKETTEVNVLGTTNVLIAAKEGGVEKVIYAASSSAYGDQDTLPLKEDMPATPNSPYGLQKYMGELLCKQWSETYDLPTVCLRYFNVYGPRLDPEGPYALVIGVFLRLKKEGKSLTITGDGTQTRDFTHVNDVVEANMLAAKSDSVKNGDILNIGYGHNYSINDLAKMFGGEIEYIPPRVETQHTLADNSKAEKLIGWKPTITLEEGVEELLEEWGFNK